jgi:hypothetical protein
VLVDLRLNYSQRHEACRALNLHYTNKSFVPMHELPTQAHRDALHATSRAYAQSIEIGLLPDGSLEIVE